jgi:hypothetical protein
MHVVHDDIPVGDVQAWHPIGHPVASLNIHESLSQIP